MKRADYLLVWWSDFKKKYNRTPDAQEVIEWLDSFDDR